MALQDLNPNLSIHDYAAIADVDWRTIADLNDFDPFADNPLDIEALPQIDIPDAIERLAPVQRVLGTVGGTIRTASTQSNRILSKVTELSGLLPASLQGYVAPALTALGSVNNAIGAVESQFDSLLSGGGANSNSRAYGGAAVRLIDWLFER